jgi:hypothetical protein
MTYDALKMLGRQQYSNAWAAISELVANGFDANAQNVYLYINMINKKDATVEIVDDGVGMDSFDLEHKYAVIGRNRRIDNPNDKAAGRKGIGKLAALYLSDEYQLVSIKGGQPTAWGVSVIGKNDNDTPSLNSIDIDSINIECQSVWDLPHRSQGTLLKLLHVDLTRIGDRAIDALKRRLSNYFLFDALESKLSLCIRRTKTDPVIFEEVKKEIAFDNMSHIYYSDMSLLDTRNDGFTVTFRDKNHIQHSINIKREELGLPSDVIGRSSGNKVTISGTATFYGITKAYSLVGWLGVHSSISDTEAKNNDDRWVRNQFYSPNEIRVYVRNKLANENILSRLGLTGTYANYIEGEVSFDILDDNELEDIATSNRQDFSIIDDRVNLLLDILGGICRQLLARRQELADKINKEQKELNASIQASQKLLLHVIHIMT